jgi:hypothetical protein
VSTQLIRLSRPYWLDVRCDVGDAIVSNLAVHVIFFFDRRLHPASLRRSFAHALKKFPIFAGRMTLADGRMRIRCKGQGVPFTCSSSGRTLDDAIRSATHDQGGWLVDPVNGAVARWGMGPLCKVRVTHLADGATAIGFSWHHSIGDMQTAMHFMNAWANAAAGKPMGESLVVEDRAAYLDEHLPADGTREPGVRCLGLAELARSAVYLAKDARRQRTMSVHFGEEEIARMCAAYGEGMRLSANDVVCGHVSEALLRADPTMDGRTLAIAVNARNRCGLDPMLAGNVITTLNLELRRGEGAGSIARRIRHEVDHYADRHCNMRTNQRFLDAAGASRAARCVSTAFNPVRWNPLVSNWSGFGVYRIQFEETRPCYFTPMMRLPVAGVGAIVDGVDGRGLIFLMSLPPRDFETLTTPAMQAYLHQFRRADDDAPQPIRELLG